MWTVGLQLFLTLIGAFVKNKERKRKLARELAIFVAERDRLAIERVKSRKDWDDVISAALSKLDDKPGEDV